MNSLSDLHFTTCILSDSKIAGPEHKIVEWGTILYLVFSQKTRKYSTIMKINQLGILVFAINKYFYFLKSLKLCKEARIYNGEKTVSSISGAGKTGQLHVKE